MSPTVEQGPGASHESANQQAGVSSASNKHLIIDCAKEESCTLAEMSSRITDMETSLRDFGKHFLKYQQDVTSILVQECLHFGQQMQDQREQLERNIHDEVHEAMISARQQIMGEINAEWKCMQDLIDVSRQALINTSGPPPEATSPWSSKCKWETPTTPQTASTAGASEDSETLGELMRLMTDLRKDFDAVHSDVSSQKTETEQRFTALETEIRSHIKEVKDSFTATPREFSFSEVAAPGAALLSEQLKTTVGMLQSLTDCTLRLAEPSAVLRPPSPQRVPSPQRMQTPQRDTGVQRLGSAPALKPIPVSAALAPAEVRTTRSSLKTPAPGPWVRSSSASRQKSPRRSPKSSAATPVASPQVVYRHVSPRISIQKGQHGAVFRATTPDVMPSVPHARKTPLQQHVVQLQAV